MKLLIKTAARNILRNSRRSLMTGSAVAAGAMAMLLFGGFVSYIFAGLETSNVQRIGHLSVFRTGYFLFGIAGNFSDGNEASKTFLGVGLVPSARDRMRQWDEHPTGQTRAIDDRLSD